MPNFKLQKSGERSHVPCVLQGFTLIETILAITVIALVVTATAELTQSSLSISRGTLAQWKAYHAAEEGLEIIRAMRDSNWLQNRPWRKDLNDGLYSIVENRRENHFPWILQPAIDRRNNEKFHRVIEIASISENKAIHVTSRVRYEEKGKDKEAVLMAEFTDWKKGPL